MMTKKTVVASLESLKQKKAQLEARIQSLEAKKSDQERKHDTRRKILIGACILDKHTKSGTYNRLIEELDNFLQKAHDRALFSLKPRETATQTESNAIKE